jgi:SOS-response transcriptional repressor LexA
MTTIDNGLGERIRQVRQAHQLTQKAFADSLGVAQGFLSSLERGRKTPSDTLLIALTHLYRVDERWLATGVGTHAAVTATATESSAPAPAAGLIPLLRRISPDFPSRLAAEDILDHIAWLGSPADGYALLAYGDFMAPTIQDNDLVLFRLGDDVKNGDIVLVTSKWEDVILRRYRVMDDGAWFAPENSRYTPFQPAPHSRLIGVVTDVWRKVKL